MIVRPHRLSIGCVTAIAAAATTVLLAAAPPQRTMSDRQSRETNPGVAILAYHRFGSAVTDSMTVRTTTFEWQLKYLADHHHPIVPLRDVVAYVRHHAPAPAPGSVVITVDDGHASVFNEMWPIVRERRIPVTLFIYPSAISNASYAMTWAQLATLRDSGLVDIQSHTYWHPNFRVEKHRLAAEAYRDFASTQLCKASAVLRDQLHVRTDILSWPFGLYDEELIAIAAECGYVAAVTLDGRLVKIGDTAMALPRILVTDAAMGSRFAAMLPPEPSR